MEPIWQSFQGKKKLNILTRTYFIFLSINYAHFEKRWSQKKVITYQNKLKLNFLISTHYSKLFEQKYFIEESLCESITIFLLQILLRKILILSKEKLRVFWVKFIQMV